MTTWFIDPLNGTDANASAGNGDSFATRRKRINNIVAAASAPGDVIRIMGSPDPTSLGVTGVWTNGPYSTTQAPTSSTNATPIVFTKVGHGLVTGDVVLINGHNTNTKANGIWDVTVSGDTFTLFNADGSNSVGNGAGTTSGTFRKITNCQVKLASALTKTVCLTGNQGTKVNWTPSANVTATLSTTDFKEGFNSQSLAIAAAFTTGLAAHYPLGSAVDFSAYQQLTFWIKQTSGTVGAAGAVTITLCSDTAGVTAVDTFNVPAVGAIGQWVPFTVNKGSALGASIQSVAFNVITDNAAQTFFLDNIQVSKASASADALSLQSLLGKNTAGETWYAIQSINGTRVMLDGVNATTPTATLQAGYFGTTETVTSYKRDTFKTSISTGNILAVQTVQESGTAGNLISYSGGWNAADMSTQTMETWLDGLSGYGTGIHTNSVDYLAFSKLALVRYLYGLNVVTTSDYITVDLIAANNNSNIGVYAEGTQGTVVVPHTHNNSTGVYVTGKQTTVTVTKAHGSRSNALYVSGKNTVATIQEVRGSLISGVNCPNAANVALYIDIISDSESYGMALQGASNLTLYDCIISNSGWDILGNTSPNYNNKLVRCSLTSAIPVYPMTNDWDQSSGIFSQGQDGDTNKHIQYRQNGSISSDTATRHTASGISWKLSPAETVYTTAVNPFFLSVAKVAVSAGTLVTASLWMRRTDIGLTARLMCKGRQLLGVMSDVATNMTAAADTWEQVTITFTPTEVGVVEILAECWGGTTYSLYVDDFAVSQA